MAALQIAYALERTSAEQPSGYRGQRRRLRISSPFPERNSPGRVGWTCAWTGQWTGHVRHHV